MLSVPIPSTKEYKLTVKYLPYNLDEAALEITFNVGDMVNANEIRTKVIENLPPAKKSIPIFVARVKDKC